MRHLHRTLWAGLCLGVAFALAAPATGHDLKGVVTQQRRLLKATGAEQSKAALDSATVQRVSTTTNLTPRVVRSVLEPLLLWPSGHKLSICFLGGDQALRSRVVQTIRARWPVGALTSKRLDYDSSFTNAPLCSDPPAADIKVSFLTGADFGGYWSYVGIEGLKFAPSMNFEGFTATSPAEPEFSRLIAHEMGHALGLDHEHQSPAAPNCTWNFVAIMANYQWASEADMHFNIDKLTNTLQRGVPKYQFSQYDRKSIMHYYFPPQNFHKGAKDPCYIPKDNSVPSKQDLKSIAAAYGVKLKDAQLLALQFSDKISAGLGAKYSQVQSLLQVKKQELSSKTNKQILHQLDTKP